MWPNERTHYKNCGFLKFAEYYVTNLGMFVSQIILQSPAKSDKVARCRTM